MKSTVSFDEFNSRLDLESIVFSLTQREDGPGWTLRKSRLLEKWYRRFLYLISLYPNYGLVPTKELDTFWHTHILDTQKYMDDCQRLFGRYFHHFPYFGMLIVSHWVGPCPPLKKKLNIWNYTLKITLFIGFSKLLL